MGEPQIIESLARIVAQVRALFRPCPSRIKTNLHRRRTRRDGFQIAVQSKLPEISPEASVRKIRIIRLWVHEEVSINRIRDGQRRLDIASRPAADDLAVIDPASWEKCCRSCDADGGVLAAEGADAVVEVVCIANLVDVGGPEVAVAAEVDDAVLAQRAAEIRPVSIEGGRGADCDERVCGE